MGEFATSTSAPRLTTLLVDRPRLRARLDEAASVTVLRAPAGFGKTTLVAQWLGRRHNAGELVIWLRARPGAGQASTFWADALRAMADAGLPVPPDAGTALRPEDLTGRADFALRQARSPVLLVVDGFQHVTDAGLDESLVDIVRHSAHLRLVVCVRGYQHFPAHQLADLDVVVLRGRDLLFTEEETQRLAALVGVDLPAATTAVLHAATGGWPEPTRSAFLRLRESADVSVPGIVTIVENVAADYLRERLLPQGHTDGRVEIALLTSLPEQFTAEAAARLTGHPSVGAHLDALDKAGVLVAELQDGERYYRWPAAARRALRSELSRQWPDRLGDLHARLARWYLEDGQVELALRHAVDAEHWPLVIQVIESGWRSLAYQHRDELVRALVTTPIRHIVTSARVLAVRDTSLNVPDDRLLGVATLPSSSDALVELGQREDAGDVLDTCLAVVIALRLRGAFDLATTYGVQALEVARSARATQPRAVSRVLPALHLHVGMTQLLAGRVAAAVETWELAYELSDDFPADRTGIDAAAKLALAHATAGDLPQAEHWLERQSKATPPTTWLTPRLASAGTAARLLVALDHLDLDTAEALDDELAAHVQRDELWPFLTLARGHYALHTDRPADALSLIDRARRTYARWQARGAVAPPLLAGLEVDALLALGRGNAATSALAGLDGHPELLLVSSARVALLSGEAERAVRLSDDARWERTATARQRGEMLLIRAVAAHRIGDRAVAVAALRRAVAVARNQRLLRLFTTVPGRDLDELADAVPAARDLLADERLTAHTGLFPEPVVLVRLTAREQRVLEDIAAGLSTPQIARASVLSYNTVRSQQRSLYKKLGARDRAEAIAHARRWGLLASDQ